jgi:hypothetical protein
LRVEIPGLKAISLQDRDDYPFAQDRLAASFEWVDYSDPVPQCREVYETCDEPAQALLLTGVPLREPVGSTGDS